jgi:hypothetical protein
VTVLVSGSIVAVVLGLEESVVPWVVPPVMAFARTLAQRQGLAPASTFALLTVQAALWSAAAIGGYVWLRRRRA